MQLLNPTVEMYSPNCTTNGTMMRKSRYLTLSAEIHNPAPIAEANATKINNGKVSMRRLGANPYQIISPTRIIPEIRKSTKLTITALAGITRRGKYSFEIIPALLIRLSPAPLNALEKNCHGSSAAKTRIG